LPYKATIAAPTKPVLLLSNAGAKRFGGKEKGRPKASRPFTLTT
jgi:hypothetical protein